MGSQPSKIMPAEANSEKDFYPLILSKSNNIYLSNSSPESLVNLIRDVLLLKWPQGIAEDATTNLDNGPFHRRWRNVAPDEGLFKFQLHGAPWKTETPGEAKEAYCLIGELVTTLQDHGWPVIGRFEVSPDDLLEVWLLHRSSARIAFEPGPPTVMSLLGAGDMLLACDDRDDLDEFIDSAKRGIETSWVVAKERDDCPGLHTIELTGQPWQASGHRLCMAQETIINTLVDLDNSSGYKLVNSTLADRHIDAKSTLTFRTRENGDDDDATTSTAYIGLGISGQSELRVIVPQDGLNNRDDVEAVRNLVDEKWCDGSKNEYFDGGSYHWQLVGQPWSSSSPALKAQGLLLLIRIIVILYERHFDPLASINCCDRVPDASLIVLTRPQSQSPNTAPSSPRRAKVMAMTMVSTREFLIVSSDCHSLSKAAETIIRSLNDLRGSPLWSHREVVTDKVDYSHHSVGIRLRKSPFGEDVNRRVALSASKMIIGIVEAMDKQGWKVALTADMRQAESLASSSVDSMSSSSVVYFVKDCQ